MRELNKIYGFFIVALLMSCSQLASKTQDNDQETQAPLSEDLSVSNPLEQSSQLNEQSAIEKLDQLKKEAESVGPHAVNYLAGDLYFKATTASQYGDVATASILFKYLVGLKPQDDYLKFKYAVELIKLGQVDESEKFLIPLFEKSKHTDEKTGLILAGVYAALGKKNESRKTYQQVYRANSQSEEACLFLARSYSMDKAYNQANQQLNHCEKKFNTNGIFSYYKGKIALERNRPKEALNHFKRSLKSDPSYYQSALAIGYIQEEGQNLDAALATYKDYLKRDPASEVMLSRIIQIYFKQEKFLDSIPFAERLISIDPSNNSLKVKLGVLYTDAKEFDKAKKIFTELIKDSTTPDKIYYYLAALYQETNDFEQALTHYGKITEESSLFEDSILQQAQILNSMAMVLDQDSGKTVYEDRFSDLVKKNSSRSKQLKVELYILKANFLESKGEVEKAIGHIEQVKDEESFSKGHKYYYATLLEKVKKFDQAEKVIWSVIDESSNNPHAWNFLGYSLLERNTNMEKALEYINKAMSLSPDDGFIRDSLGWYYYKTGRIDKALIELKKARKKVATDMVISKHLAEVYHAQENYDMARKYYLEALKNSKQNFERQEVLESMERMERKRMPASLTSKPMPVAQ